METVDYSTGPAPFDSPSTDPTASSTTASPAKSASVIISPPEVRENILYIRTEMRDIIVNVLKQHNILLTELENKLKKYWNYGIFYSDRTKKLAKLTEYQNTILDKIRQTYPSENYQLYDLFYNYKSQQQIDSEKAAAEKAAAEKAAAEKAAHAAADEAKRISTELAKANATKSAAANAANKPKINRVDVSGFDTLNFGGIFGGNSVKRVGGKTKRNKHRNHKTKKYNKQLKKTNRKQHKKQRRSQKSKK